MTPAKFAVAASAALFLAAGAPSIASAQNGPAAVPAPPAGKAEVVFFRDKSFKASGFAYAVREDGKPLGTARRGSYFVAILEPGAHAFTVQSEVKDALHMEVEAGETYYVLQTMDIGLLFTTARLTPSDAVTFGKLSPRRGPAADEDAGSKAER